ncbi:hypothetical protein BDV26DRAFT_275337 [Aspergillus bertholletiae]|uniref:Uncharacterized protein n=1 Tax=Aspergillus bertholletiae TaxID=1226010 RepID=A0A5N7APN6_9EURO|nr:hypothetical protein BDV26DRAFT_275337 [Aspergillus bertholletiae]
MGAIYRMLTAHFSKTGSLVCQFTNPKIFARHHFIPFFKTLERDCLLTTLVHHL